MVGIEVNERYIFSSTVRSIQFREADRAAHWHLSTAAEMNPDQLGDWFSCKALCVPHRKVGDSGPSWRILKVSVDKTRGLWGHLNYFPNTIASLRNIMELREIEEVLSIGVHSPVFQKEIFLIPSAKSLQVLLIFLNWPCWVPCFVIRILISMWTIYKDNFESCYVLVLAFHLASYKSYKESRYNLPSDSHVSVHKSLKI